MTKRVLDVGNCGPDHAAIKRMLQRKFSGVEVVPVDDFASAAAALRKQTFNLVLVNRKLDCDYSDGLDVIKQIKAAPELSASPCMLVTNLEEHQQLAVAAGALPGFGKLQFDEPRTAQRLAEVLG